MGRGIVLANGGVVAHSNQLAIFNDDCANRHFSGLRCERRLR
jgi:hypothetical protein